MTPLSGNAISKCAIIHDYVLQQNVCCDINTDNKNCGDKK
jgi:hypothetical protein